MNEETMVFAPGQMVIQELAQTRGLLLGTSHVALVDELLDIELRIALMGSRKALSKLTKDDNVRAIK